MSGITNWRKALTDARFWACRYAFHFDPPEGDDAELDDFFGLSAEQREEYFLLLFGDDDFDTPLPPGVSFDSLADIPPTSLLTLSFPESFTWALEFGWEGIFHQIFHPLLPPRGLAIAEESGHFRLPGLRWTELRQIVACLQQQWSMQKDLASLDPCILYPLLYPVVELVTSADYDEVRQTLRTAWETLEVIEPSLLERWLDETIQVCESEEELWVSDPVYGWYTQQPYTPRHHAHLFFSFFEMVQRCSQNSRS